MAANVDSNFPVHGLLPKKETGAWNFLTKFPDYDGRNTLIAILDSGVDPGASGLQQTSDGKVKILDLYDATGAGDVDTSKVVEAEDGFITGLTGRKLKIPESWSNPSGSYHIGVKTAFSLFPNSLKSRVSKQRKTTQWSKPHNKLLAEAMKDKEAASKANETCKTETERLARDERNARLELLTTLDDKYSTCGPVYDCIVFNDGTTWRACVDTSEKGDLESCKLMASYQEEYQYAPFSACDMLNYSVNIYDDGNLLEICTNSGSHGTHVASITTAYEADSAERCGVAPGAQIISVKIGDSRLGGSEETSSAIVRAMLRVMRWKCDLVNMSFGEPSKWSNDGRVVEIITEAVEKHGVVFVTSAGNSGPALSTVGAPAGSSSVISVGAHVTPDMMQAEYSMRDRLPSINYTWSSRGPTLGGDFGVDICAPGVVYPCAYQGAITSIPNWTLCCQDLMNGTSMSSPNTCGCLSLVVSGLKDRQTPYTSASLKRAMINSAKTLPNVEAPSQGHGLIQVDRMFEHMQQYNNLPEDIVSFDVSVNGDRGIYLREPHQVNKNHSEHTVKIIPRFYLPDSEPVDEEQQRCKIHFKMSLCVVCNESWVTTSQYVELMNTDRNISVKIDIASLSHGVHSTQICCYDTTCIEKGPVVRVPITVIIPESTANSKDYQMCWTDKFKPGQINRHFLHVPAGATSANFQVNPVSGSEPTFRIYFQSLQLEPGENFTALEHEKFGIFEPGNQNSTNFAVKENTTLELCICKWWSSLGDTDMEYNIQFHGATTSQSPVVMHAGESVKQLNVRSDLRRQLITPTVTFTSLVQMIRPSNFSLNALTSCRDQLPNGRQTYAAVLDYNFKMTKPGEVNPNFNLLSSMLYESPLESQMWFLFNSNKQHLLTGDAYPVKYNYSTKLDAGDYTIKLQLRHEDRQLLESLKKSAMTLIHKLPSGVSIDVYRSQKQAVISGMKAGPFPIAEHGVAPLFFTSIPDEKLAKVIGNGSTGSYLSGSLNLIPEHKTGDLPFHYVLCDPCKLANNSKDKNGKSDAKKDKKTEYNQAKLDMEIKWISKLEPQDGMKLYKQLLADHAFSNLSLQVSALTLLQKLITNKLDKTDKADEKPAGAAEEEASADGEESADLAPAELIREFFNITRSVLQDDANVDKQEMLAFLGTKNDNSESATARKTEMNKRRDQLIEIYLLHISMMSDLLIKPHDLELEGVVSKQLLQDSWNDLIKFTDLTDKKVTKTYIKYLRANGCLCMAGQSIMKLNDKDKQTEELLYDIFGELGWDHAQQMLKDWMMVRYPPYYALF